MIPSVFAAFIRILLQMIARRVLVSFVLLLFVHAAICQTFQYSRGWTNGKRSEFPSAADITNPPDERFTNGELKRLKMLVHGNVDEQVYFNSVIRVCIRNSFRVCTFRRKDLLM